MPARGRTVTAVDRPVQWMTTDELRLELLRTQQAWEAQVHDVDLFLAAGVIPWESPDALRHRLVAAELLRRAGLPD